MPDPRTRVLVVNPKLNQAVGMKNAIEAVGGFEVRPFTSSLNALEFARTAPPDAAVLDLAIRSPGIGETTVALRKLNPKIKLLLTNAPDEAVTKLRADGLVSLPARARELEPMLRALFPPDAGDRPNTPSRRPLELLDAAPKKPAHDPALPDPFERIADEEPPVPTAIEGGTVREAVRAMLPRQPLDESMYVVEITPRPHDTDEQEPAAGTGDWRALTPAEELAEKEGAEGQEARAEDNAAQPVAEAPAAPAQTEAPPLASPQPDPAPAPAFDDSDADLDEAPPVDGQPLAASARQPAQEITPPAAAVQPEAPDADRQPATERPQPAAEIKVPGQRRPVKKKDAPAPPVVSDEPPAAPAVPPPPQADAPPVNIPGVRRKPKTAAQQPAAEPDEAPAARSPVAINPEDLRRALMLTHEQIGTTAAALILTQGSDMIAHSGEMPTQEIEELEQVVGGDWDVSGTQARLRYVTLPTSRQEYMLHTRRTENGYALSMAFAGDLALREIRAQSDAVASTLDSMAEAEAETDSSTPRLPFTAVWMLNEPADPLTADVAQAVVLRFDRELRALGWPIHAMNVHADFVYVYCDVQTTYLASEVVADLKRISAEAACERRPDWDPDELWADAYMALMPGRELGSDEVQSFLAFTRARLHRNGGS